VHGKVVVISGATSGIGQVAAVQLAAQGARLVLVARSKARAEEMLRRLREIGAGMEHRAYYADLSVLEEVRRVAAAIAAAEPRIDVLVNNAGAVFSRRRVTVDGLEMTFALNHMSYFLLAHGLCERLYAASGARVVNVASEAHRRADVDFSDLQAERGLYMPFKVYGRTKLCNILFTRALARRWADKGVAVNCLHPGFVNTRFGDESGGWYAYAVWLAKRFAIPPEEGARTLIYLASSSDVANVSGGYFYKCAPKAPSAQASDDAAAERLWRESERIAALT
jgi:NAD(P)-dependent dehydrogenase (short-subunit alcohol dehydrogenase family)